MTESTEPVRVIEETSAYWRVVFDYPPFNIVDATIFAGLEDLLSLEWTPVLRSGMDFSCEEELTSRPWQCLSTAINGNGAFTCATGYKKVNRKRALTTAARSQVRVIRRPVGCSVLGTM